MRSDSLLFIQVYTDEHVAPVLATLLRQRGYVAQSAQEAGMLGRDDEEHLAYATQNNMAILTFNGKDFDRLAREWVAVGREHAGIVISPQLSRDRMGELLHSLIRLLDSLTADEIRNQVVYLQRFGARRPRRISEIAAEYAASVTPL
ncbi:MAG TPA: DUF5615 family PIN-like protein [Anaerolineae bacterium]|nr:DUF5615 family PIN-like protein [Anaerolineae bacterium]